MYPTWTVSDLNAVLSVIFKSAASGLKCQSCRMCSITLGINGGIDALSGKLHKTYA
ncbi:hypothetical protein LDENG_00101400 [Lucifuga dentata]|nr:hypothetical protein LDENG_00101400 [Lucifuga dentata]